MNNNPNPNRRQRPDNGRTPERAARGGQITVLSAILTGRRSRSIACVIVALVIALTAVVSVAASIVSSHIAESDENAKGAVLSNDKNALKADDASTDKQTDAGSDDTAAASASDAASTDTAKNTDKSKDDSEKSDDGKADDAEAKDGENDAENADGDDAKTEDGDKTDEKSSDTDAATEAQTKAPGVHTITITFYDKEDLVSDTMAKTLGDFLLYSGVTLSEAQLANLDLSTKLESDMTFMADKISYDTITEDEPLAFETQYRDTTEIAEGTESVIQEGVNGVLTTAFDVKYVNGVEVYREQKGSWASTEAIDRIVLRGVAPAVTEAPAAVDSTDTEQSDSDVAGAVNDSEVQVDAQSGSAMSANGLPAATVFESGYITGADGVSRHYYAYIDVQATVYSAGGTTAYGLPADERVMGVGRYDGTLTPIIPFGTVCYVVSSRGDCGERISADFGNMFGNKIDLCMYPSNPMYAGFGWQSARVYLLG